MRALTPTPQDDLARFGPPTSTDWPALDLDDRDEAWSAAIWHGEHSLDLGRDKTFDGTTAAMTARPASPGHMAATSTVYHTTMRVAYWVNDAATWPKRRLFSAAEPAGNSAQPSAGSPDAEEA
jgi:hypothetical protein